MLCRETPEFTAPDLWPSNSPNLNPVDYLILGVMQELIYHTPSQDVADPRRGLMSVVDEAIDQWRKGRDPGCLSTF